MSHIAEGLLHAHLDGALGPGEQLLWTEAARHLEVCEDCRRRLEEAREIREAASALLAGATVQPAARPGFDALVAEAAARREPVKAASMSRTEPSTSRRWWASPMKLAWAASLVLAVGAGWISRQVMVEQGEPLPGLVAEGDLARTGSTDMDGEFRSRPEAAGAVEEPARPASPVTELEGEGFADRRAANPPDATPRERDARREAAADPPARDRLADEIVPAEAAEQERRVAEANDDAPARADADVAGDAEPGADVGGRGQSLAPQARAAKAAEGMAECYVPATRSGEEGRAAAENAAPEPGAQADALDRTRPLVGARQLRLEPDGTATLEVEGRPMVGFWTPTEADGRVVRLTDGEGWWELALSPRDGRFRANLVAPTDSDEAADAVNRPLASLEFAGQPCP